MWKALVVGENAPSFLTISPARSSPQTAKTWLKFVGQGIDGVIAKRQAHLMAYFDDGPHLGSPLEQSLHRIFESSAGGSGHAYR
jgi:hypothetical protein